MAHAIANAAGATWFDLSPRNTDAKFPGKDTGMMVHAVSALKPAMPMKSTRVQPRKMFPCRNSPGIKTSVMLCYFHQNFVCS